MAVTLQQLCGQCLHLSPSLRLFVKWTSLSRFELAGGRRLAPAESSVYVHLYPARDAAYGMPSFEKCAAATVDFFFELLFALFAAVVNSGR